MEEGEDEDDDGIQEISSKHLWRAIRKFGPTVWGRKKTAAISLKDVEEMVYDADVIDQSGDMKVSLSELLNALEMVATEEIKQDLGKSEQGMIRVPTGRHLAALMSTLGGGVVVVGGVEGVCCWVRALIGVVCFCVLSSSCCCCCCSSSFSSFSSSQTWNRPVKRWWTVHEGPV